MMYYNIPYNSRVYAILLSVFLCIVTDFNKTIIEINLPCALKMSVVY